MRAIVSGASGLIGGALCDALASGGCTVVRLVRRETAGPNEIAWDPVDRKLDPAALDGADALIHLGGAGIASGRWTDARKQRIRDSRVVGTGLLAEALVCAQNPPKVWVCASAVGYYGDRGDEILSEDAEPGRGFLPDVCRAWEEATDPAIGAGIRVVGARFGMVLSRDGGAFPKLHTLFRMGLGGVLGSGRQYMSWITLEDAVRALQRLILAPDVPGPVNIVAPEPVTNAAFTRALGKALRRPTLLPAPAFAMRMALGEMADALLLASARAVPARLQADGFTFNHPQIDVALAHVLRR